MKISLIDVDGHNYPNFALMKISAWHKANGDAVDWYSPLFSNPERIYASKVFTFTPDFSYINHDVEIIKGGLDIENTKTCRRKLMQFCRITAYIRSMNLQSAF